MVKKIKLISQFEKFIRCTANGIRRKPDGSRIKKATIENYEYVLKLLMDYEIHSREELWINTQMYLKPDEAHRERQRWQEFYRSFSRFLFYQKKCHDNYCGHVFKIIKCFLHYLDLEFLISNPYKLSRFHIRKEEITIISLLPEQFAFLIKDEGFHNKLHFQMRRTKDAFIFGCTAALRYSDLMNLRVRDLEKRGNEYFLNYMSLKTSIPVKVKLPEFAIKIFFKYARRKRAVARVFPSISLSYFNKCLKKIGEKAGWNYPLGKFRTQSGVRYEQRMGTKRLRFCDMLSSHVMRRTGITFLLMLGMPEFLVRKISGHAAHSRTFFRYVNFAHTYVTDEINKVYDKLNSLYLANA